MKVNQILGLSLILCLMMACEEEINIDLPDQQKTVVISNFTTDSLFRVFLSHSNSITNDDFSYPENATIQFFKNGDFIENLTFEQGELEHAPYYFSDKPLEVNGAYSIRIELEGHSTVEAEGLIPPLVTAVDWQLVEQKRGPDGFLLKLQTELSFRDTSYSDPYYHLTFWQKGTIPDKGIGNIDQADLAPTSKFILIKLKHENGALLDVSNLVTAERKLDLGFVGEFSDISDTLCMSLRHVSRDYYLFHKSLNDQRLSSNQQDIIFADPTITHNNILGGLGNFSGFSEISDSLIW